MVGSFRVTVALLALMTALSGRASADEIVFEQGLEYAKADGQSLPLNLARPKNATGKVPAILCIHGGGFRAGKREGWDGRCKLLAERGYVAATATYRLAP